MKVYEVDKIRLECKYTWGEGDIQRLIYVRIRSGLVLCGATVGCSSIYTKWHRYLGIMVLIDRLMALGTYVNPSFPCSRSVRCDEIQITMFLMNRSKSVILGEFSSWHVSSWLAESVLGR